MALIKSQRQEHTGISTLKDSTSDHVITDPAELRKQIATLN